MNCIRRIFSIIMLVALALTFVVPASAEENWSWENGVLTITGQMDDYANPDKVPWRKVRKEVVKVVLPDATEIGTYAFYGCVNLESISMPKVTTVGDHAFHGCKKLKTVDLQNVTAIGAYAFYDSGLSYITIPAAVAELKESVFEKSALICVGFEGNAVSVNEAAFAGITATAYYPAGQWSSDKLQNYGGTLTWKEYTYTVEAYAGKTLVRTYYDMQTAADTYDTNIEYLKLNCDLNVNITLTRHLHIDLAGHDLTGVVKTGEYKVYGLDSTTDGYSSANIGYFKAAVDQVDAFRLGYRTGSPKRYISIKDGNGWSFHRFYLGITRTSLQPDTTGILYEAQFHGDDMVLAQVDAVGFQLWTNKDHVAEYALDGYQKEATLRIKNIDPAKSGETVVNAGVFIKLKDGTVIESRTYNCSLRSMLELANANLSDYTARQIQAVQTMCNTYAENTSAWNIQKILNWKESV